MQNVLARHLIDEGELLQLLNWELAAYEECVGCRFRAVKALPAGDDSGCNWVDAELESDAPLDLAGRMVARHIVEDTRRAFNLALH